MRHRFEYGFAALVLSAVAWTIPMVLISFASSGTPNSTGLTTAFPTGNVSFTAMGALFVVVPILAVLIVWGALHYLGYPSALTVALLGMAGGWAVAFAVLRVSNFTAPVLYETLVASIPATFFAMLIPKPEPVADEADGEPGEAAPTDVLAAAGVETPASAP